MISSTTESKKSTGFWEENKLHKAVVYLIKLCNKQILAYKTIFSIFSDKVISV